MQRYRTGLVFIIGAVLLAAVAGAQNYEVRSFVGDPADTDGTYQYLYNSVRQQYVCSYCSFSRGTPGTCPDPWQVPAHPGSVTLMNLANLPRERFLALAAQAMPDAAHSDLALARENPAAPPIADLVFRALLGRPYKPTDSDGNMVRSQVYAAAAGLINNDAGLGPEIDTGDPVRWLVLPPTPLRRDPRATDQYTPNAHEYGLPQRRPRAQADPGTDNGGNDLWQPQVLEFGGPTAFAIPAAELSNYLQISVNPYRVDEGDYWFVRVKEMSQDNGLGTVIVKETTVEIYSVLYGWQGPVDAAGAPYPLHFNNGGVSYPNVNYPFSVVADSGAIKLDFMEGADGQGGWSDQGTGGAINTWTIGFMVRSNCRLVPGWLDMYAAGTDPEFPDIRDPGGPKLGNAGFDLINDSFPGRKDCWMAAAAGTPTVTMTSNIVETGAPPSAGFMLRPDETGEGIVAVQWRKPDPAPEPAWSPDPQTGNGPNVTYYREGYEWQYDAGVNGAAVTEITNAEVAAGTATNYTAAYPYVHLAGARFMSTRPEVRRTNTQWDKDGDGAGDEDAETQAINTAYAKVILGQISFPLVFGAYGPGSVTPRRTYEVLNRWHGEAEARACETCGAVFPPAPDGTGGWVPYAGTQCPYHAPPPLDVDELTVTGAGVAGYDGIYTRVPGPVNGWPYYVHTDGFHFIYHAAAPKTRWLMSTSTAIDWKSAQYWRNLQLVGQWVLRTPAPPGDVAPLVSVPAGTPNPDVFQVAQRGGGSYAAAHQEWREATTVGVDERVAAAPARRLVLPGSAFQGAGRTITPNRDGATPGAEDIWAEIPRYQPPSVPGAGLINDYANDLGYRGGQVLFRNEPLAQAPHDLIGTPLTTGWDTFYRNPDNGYFQPRAGEWPYRCAGEDAANPADDHIVWGAACAQHPAAMVLEVAGRHYFCPLCGTEYKEQRPCAFDGATIGATQQIPINLAVRPEHLCAEEFEPYEVQVSVNRTGGLAQSQSNIEVGRMAPGVRSQRPDTTVQPLSTHRAFPADVSPLPAWPYRPSDAKVLLRNEGNIALSLRVGNTYDFDEANILDRSLDHYLRVDVDPQSLSYGRKAQSGPVTRDTFVPGVAPAVLTPYGINLSPLWNLTAPNADAGQFAGNAGEGFVTAGTYTGRPTAKPVPLGQPVGTYTGQHLQYVDVNSNGVFDFAYWDGSAYVDTDSGVCPRPFNPSIDMPQEPLAGLLGGQMRVFETRLPQSDYYARDSDPVVLPSPTPGQMQIIWSTNRPSITPVTGAGAAAPAGTDPTDLPNSNTPLNLVYVTTAGVIGGADDPLYRQYQWPTSGGAIVPPTALTAGSAGTVNSAPWATYNWDGSLTPPGPSPGKWAFWHREMRYVRPDGTGAAGVERTLRFKGISGAGWTWPAADNWIYDTGQPKQGLRGFPQPLGMWLFWHEGNPGRERIMYRWDFTGTVSNNEAPVPVTNVAGAGLTDLVSALYWDGAAWLPATIRRAGQSPFTYTRDVSVFPYNGLVNVFFSGFVTHEGQADICWTRFNLASMGPTAAADNYAKRPFPTLTTYEELQAGGWHQMFGSRHLDWMVAESTNPTTPTSAAYTPAFQPRDEASLGDGYSPRLQLQLVYDTLGDGLPAAQQTVQIRWNANDAGNYYDRARGIHRVTPILMPSSVTPAPSLAAPWFYAAPGGGWYMRDPHSSATNPRPVTMDINPAAGTIVFSSPLFNEDAPGDPTAVLTNAPGLNFGGAALEDVVVQAIYTPYVYRVTRSGAADDSPSAFYDPTAGSRLTVFWRRSFPASESPHFGRPAFMYKAFTTSIQVGRQPVTGGLTITDLNTGLAVTPLGPPEAPAPNDDAGIYSVNPALIGHRLQVTYDGAGGTYTEIHQVIGWSQEMVVPVDTVVGEGAFVAVPEEFRVPRVEGADPVTNGIPAVRYWLYWASPRGVYDLRLVEDPGGTRYQPTGANPHDLPVHPSSDIYTAVVAPEFGSLVPERAVPTVVPGGT
jgi:hypothetical protein